MRNPGVGAPRLRPLYEWSESVRLTACSGGSGARRATKSDLAVSCLVDQNQGMEGAGDRPMTDWEAVVLRSGRYVVPSEREKEFMELLSRAHAIYERHALDWTVLRSREDPTQWREFGLQFREEANLRAARQELEEPPSILEALDQFETGDPYGVIAEVYSSADWETVFRLGEKALRERPRRLPPIPPDEMTEAMRRAQRLACAVAPRLEKIAPADWKVSSDQEVVYIRAPDGTGRNCSLVDIEPAEAVLYVMGELAEDATEELTVPWPHDPEQGYTEHDPDVEVRQGAIHAWYGSRDAPVLTMDPIPLSELED
jgi:hypothetical protein